MNEWASSPWANDNNTSSSIAHLSPIPPSFAKTSPTLDSDYFNSFKDDAAWGESGTPSIPGSSSFDEGTITGVVGSGAWAGLQSPRPIASPGRIANGKGNRWLRPATVDDIGKSEDAVAGAEVGDEEGDAAGLENPIAVGAVKNVDEDMGIEDKSFRSTEETGTDGLGIAMGSLDVQQAPVVHGAQDDLKDEIEFDNVHLSTTPRTFPESPHWRAVEDDSNTHEQPTGSEANEAKIPASLPELLETGRDDSHVIPVKRPSVDFQVDFTLLSQVFPPTNPDVTQDLPLFDTIITTSSARKTHYRITRPYSLRQYNSGNFENYSRVTWRDSAIHEKAVKYVEAWITKDRAFGGGVFDVVPNGKRRSGFGWGSDNERVSDQKPTISASSIMLPKIVGPSGAFGWSSAAMTPLQPLRAGEEQEQVGPPKASAEVADMQPRPRRTPIRKSRAVSNKVSGSNSVSKSTPPAIFDEFDMFEKQDVPADDQTYPDFQQGADGAPQQSSARLTDDFGVFEDATDDFQDFVITPPPSRPTTTPPMEVLENVVNIEDELDHKETHTPAEGEIHDVDNTIIRGEEDSQNSTSAVATGGVRDDFSTSASSTAPNVLNTKSPEKESLFAGQEDEFDEFEPFESAPALAFSNDSPVEDTSYMEHDQNDSVSLPAKHRADVGFTTDDFSAFENTGATTIPIDDAKSRLENEADVFNDFDAPETAHPVASSNAGPNPFTQHGENKSDLHRVQQTEHKDSTTAEDAGHDAALRNEHAPEPNEPVHHASSEQHPELQIEHSQAIEDDHAQTTTPTSEDIIVASITSPPAPLNDMIYDDFSIFESRPTISQQLPSMTTPDSVMASQINHTAKPSLSLPRPSALPNSSSIIQQQATTSDAINDDDDDDEFGAFEEAIAPKHQSLDSRLQWEPATQDIDTFFSQRRPISTPLPARFETQVATKQQQQPTSTPSPIPRPTAPTPASIQTASALSPKSIATKPIKTKPIPKQKVKDNNTGASILNILAFLDEADNGNDDDDDEDGRVLYDQHPAEVEALAGKKVIKRLAREEWVGEKPKSVIGDGLSRQDVGERQKGNGVEQVDEKVVEGVVKGLPDWGFMLGR